MQRKVSMLMLMALFGVLLSVSALAQKQPAGGSSPKVKPTPKPAPQIPQPNVQWVTIYLDCRVAGPSEFPNVYIKNNTTQNVAAGTKINWEVNSAMKGVHTLQNTLAPGQEVKFSVEARGNGGIPKAWYLGVKKK